MTVISCNKEPDRYDVPRQVYAVLADALLLAYFQVLLPSPQPCQRISVLNLIAVRPDVSVSCTIYSLSPEIPDGFEMCVAHRAYLEYPAVLPFFCALLNLSRSYWDDGNDGLGVRTSFKSAFLCSLVFFETFVSDTGSSQRHE